MYKKIKYATKKTKNPTTLKGNGELFQNPTDVPRQIIEAWQ